MPSLKDLKNRIASVQSTQKITSAMKMVAASKLKKAEAAASQGRPYARRMERMLSGLVASLPNLETTPKLLAGYGSDDPVAGLYSSSVPAPSASALFRFF